MIAQLVHEETALKIQKAKVAHENPFAQEMETNEKEFAEFTTRQIQVEPRKGKWNCALKPCVRKPRRNWR